jgi:putative phosphoribosyl transferase
MLFRDRTEAGKSLAQRLSKYAGREDVLVLGLPRGGVPVAYEVAAALHAPLDVFLVRKLGVPGAEELAMGALASGGVRVLDSPLIRRFQIPPEAVAYVTRAEERELERRERSYRAGLPPLDVGGKTVILVDDGLATGASMRAAVSAVRRLGPSSVVVAVPVAPPSARGDLSSAADEFVCVATPEPFYSVGRFYDRFDQTSDEEVHDLLSRSAADRTMEVTP